MSNLIGQVLLEQFRVDAFVASGGMGAVYRVWDLKRNTPLAMKVLHSELAEDPSVFKRFQREASALKKLAHPHIVPFYGLYQTLDFAFLLERFIDGLSLKDILRQRKGQPLPVEETLTYLKALSAALGYAHANGVVHCDVKPGNVIVDQGGSVYLADFGIARHAESTTTTMGAAGTPAYMAPEQIRGEMVSPATDIYALGVMLYEMLTGQRPFRGNEAGTEKGGSTANERIRYGHLNLPPVDPRAFNPSLSAGMSAVILKALGKEAGGRYASTLELLAAVCSAANTHPGEVTDHVPPPGFPAGRDYTSGQVVIPAAPSPAPSRPVSWLAIGAAVVGVLGVLGVVLVIVIIAFLNNRAASPLQTSPTSGISASPDVSASRPAPLIIYTATSPAVPQPAFTATFTDTPWPTDTPRPTDTPLPTATPSRSNRPQGKIVYTCQVYGEELKDQICLMNADGSGNRQLTYNSSENFYASLSPDGSSIVFSSNQSGDYEIYEMDLNGRQTRLTYNIGSLYAPEISPDGRHIVFTNINSKSEIWVMHRDGSQPYLVYSPSSGDAVDPVWSPDGQQILLAAGADYDKQLYVINVDGSGLHAVGGSYRTRGRSDWSPDGALIASYAKLPSGIRGIFLLDLDGLDIHQIDVGGDAVAPSFSPDGGWLAFMGYLDLSGGNGCEIYVMQLDGSRRTRLTNNNYCDYQPRWGP